MWDVIGAVHMVTGCLLGLVMVVLLVQHWRRQRAINAWLAEQDWPSERNEHRELDAFRAFDRS